MSPTLTHLALHVPDLDACIAFYETFCGMRVIHRRPGKGSQIVWMAEPSQEQRFIFVIMPGGQPAQPGQRRLQSFRLRPLQPRRGRRSGAPRRGRRLPGLGAARRALSGRLLLRPARPGGQLRGVQLRPAAGPGFRGAADSLTGHGGAAWPRPGWRGYSPDANNATPADSSGGADTPHGRSPHTKNAAPPSGTRRSSSGTARLSEPCRSCRGFRSRSWSPRCNPRRCRSRNACP